MAGCSVLGVTDLTYHGGGPRLFWVKDDVGGAS